MAMRMSERIDRALKSGDPGVFFDAAGGLPAGVGEDALSSVIMLVGRDCGLSADEVGVLSFLVAVTQTREWRGTKAWPRVRARAVDIARHRQMDARRVVEAERGLAAKGWIGMAAGADGGAGSPRVGNEMDELCLRPLLERWETICHMVVALWAARRAVNYLRAAIEWRADGLGRESTQGEVEESGLYATLADVALECDRLLLSLEVLIDVPLEFDDDTQPED